MNILIKRALIAAGVTAVMVIPMAGQASDGTITFTGAVTANTCTISVNGGAATTTVALPTVDTAALTGTSPKTTAAGTFFSMAVTNCTSPAVADIGGSAPTHVAIYFEAGLYVDQATGGLINAAASGSNVEVMLYNASGSATAAATVVGTQIMPGTPTHQPAALAIGAGGTQWFYAGYSTTGAAASGATAGAVSTQITYSLVYS